jgi:hypothetical protein
MKRFGWMVMMVALVGTAAHAETIASLAGHYEGSTFNGDGPCTMTLTLERGWFGQALLKVEIQESDKSMTYEAKVATLEKTLREGHYGEGVAHDGTSHGVLSQSTRYVHLQLLDGKLSSATIDHTESDVGWVKLNESVSCGVERKLD